jgi:hypothetical protein
MKRIVFVVTVALVMVMLAVAPVFAQGGCKAFGVQGVSDQARNEEGEMGGYASFFGPQDAMDDMVHLNQEQFCSGSGR